MRVSDSIPDQEVSWPLAQVDRGLSVRGLCYLLILPSVCYVGTSFPAERPAEPELGPGKEVRIDQEKGAGYFVVYVPTDYAPERRWPVIFCYHGQGGPPTTWPFKDLTGGKGFIIVGMGFLDTSQRTMTLAEFDRYIGQEMGVVNKAAAYLERRLKLDREEFLVGGFSMGGWMTSSMGEGSPSMWAGIAILGAGRQMQDRPMRNPASLRNKPIYIGAGTQDNNFAAARRANDIYRAAGAKVTFEEYPGLGHTMKMDTTVLRDWLSSVGPLRLAKARLAAAQATEQSGRLGRAYGLYRELAPVSDKDESCLAAAAAAKAISEVAEKKLAESVKAVAEKRYDDASRQIALLATRYEGSAFGERADAMIRTLQSDPAAQAALKAAKLEPAKAKSSDAPAPDAARECLAWLRLADNYLAAGKSGKAGEYLNKIIDKYPSTEWAAQARERIAKIGKGGD